MALARSFLLFLLLLGIFLLLFPDDDSSVTSALALVQRRPGNHHHHHHRESYNEDGSSSAAGASSQGQEGFSTSWSRREWLSSSGSAAGLSTTFLVAQPRPANAAAAPDPPTQGRRNNEKRRRTPPPYLTDEYYGALKTAPESGRSYFPALTPPFAHRATYRYDLGRGAHAFEQLLTFANVSATIRTNVIELTGREGGGLWVHGPQWPTGELCELLHDLGKPVKHIILSCNALEHKAPMKDFAAKFPDAQVWIAPGQYGPFGSCGRTFADKVDMGYRVDGILGPGNPLPPWADEFDLATLYVDLPQNAGPVSEVAFCHRPTRTLVVTDAVVYVPDGPTAPDIFATYFPRKGVYDDPTFWPKTVLQAVFLPLRTDDDGNYPGFDAIRERLVRAPILRAFADARAPDAVRDWITEISSGAMDFDRILTSHFASPIRASPSDFAAAFGYLFEEGRQQQQLPPIACRDWDLLEGLNRVISEYNLGAPATFDYRKGCL